ncbi:MAG: UDP-4-amino-4-deoxy-L-arabinose--oxoglutarate aminotransferase [bacterium ADurb.Bin243]|nr:MAG: UDP-4-amino-4-deoxy-L-arabinose--oxoglutarate aminotransferase [bacterium ADurb.Bin243]
MQTSLRKEKEFEISPDFIPFHKAWFGPEEENEILDTLRSGWITTGPKTKKFEEDFKNYCQAKHCVALNSCTAALHLAYAALGVGPGDEVITTPMTFAATANVAVHLGAKPVFADIMPETLNIHPAEIEKKLTAKTRVITAVHYVGQPCKMDEISEIARSKGVAVVEDAAHATEAVYKGRKIGSISDMTAFSFYATKNITCGEGGALCVNRDDLIDKIRILGLHGMSKDAWKRYSKDEFKHYEILYPGYKYNMFDIQASLVMHQLKKVEQFWELRKRYVDKYNEAFKDIEQIKTLKIMPDVKHSYHLYTALLKTEMLKCTRDEFLSELQKLNIGVSVHFIALHLHPFYRDAYGYKRGDFPNAEYASDRVISLPLFPRMNDKDVEYVISAVAHLIKKYKK